MSKGMSVAMRGRTLAGALTAVTVLPATLVSATNSPAEAQQVITCPGLVEDPVAFTNLIGVVEVEGVSELHCPIVVTNIQGTEKLFYSPTAGAPAQTRATKVQQFPLSQNVLTETSAICFTGYWKNYAKYDVIFPPPTLPASGQLGSRVVAKQC